MLLFVKKTKISCAVLCCSLLGRKNQKQGCKETERLVRKAGSVTGAWLDTLGEVTERCTIKMLEAIRNSFGDLLYNILTEQKNVKNLPLHCKTQRYRKSFAPKAIRLFKSHSNSRWAKSDVNFSLASVKLFLFIFTLTNSAVPPHFCESWNQVQCECLWLSPAEQ